MDVSGWTIAQRMRFPDWCFGNRELVSVFTLNEAVGTYVYNISTLALPDPVCIWQVCFQSVPDATGGGRIRVGFAAAVPTNEAEMDAAVDFLPHFGHVVTGPNKILFQEPNYVFFSFDVRKGLVTGGKKLVSSTYCTVAKVRINCFLLVSGLPTDMAGWLAHSKV